MSGGGVGQAAGPGDRQVAPGNAGAGRSADAKTRPHAIPRPAWGAVGLLWLLLLVPIARGRDPSPCLRRNHSRPDLTRREQGLPSPCADPSRAVQWFDYGDSLAPRTASFKIPDTTCANSLREIYDLDWKIRTDHLVTLGVSRQTGPRPDLRRIRVDNMGRVQGVARAVGALCDPEPSAIVDGLAAFVQGGICYASPLIDDQTPAVPLWPPPKVLASRKGDCDSKVALFGTLLADILNDRGRDAGDLRVVYCQPTFEVTVRNRNRTPTWDRDLHLVHVVNAKKNWWITGNMGFGADSLDLDPVLQRLCQGDARVHALAKIPKGSGSLDSWTGEGRYERTRYVVLDLTCYGIEPPDLQNFRLGNGPLHTDADVTIDVLYEVEKALDEEIPKGIEEDPL